MTESFTEVRYVELMNLIKKNFKIIPFTEFQNINKTLLLRHDIDFSVHRAAKISNIEHDLKIISTYFINPHSRFYNIHESEIYNKVKEIKKNGHRFGLHLDLHYWNEIDKPIRLGYEKEILEMALHIEIDAISFHMPSLMKPTLLIDAKWVYLEGMVNTNSPRIKDRFDYCSDSLCNWRHGTLENKIETSNAIHLLLHPDLWTDSEMKCEEKINRCISGRAERCKSQCESVFKEWEQATGEKIDGS